MQQLLGENWEVENRERDSHCRKFYFNNSKPKQNERII